MAKRREEYGADGVYMSDEDLDLLDQYQNLYNSYKELGNQGGMDAAHDAAEKLRAKYNYSGGGAGNEYIKINTTNPTQAQPFTYESAPEYVSRYQSQIDDLSNQLMNIQPFSYEAAPEYTSRYQSQIDELANSILNRPDFSYDYQTDPQWQSYKKQYTREGRRASEDVMGQYAAMTGGMPSTAAVTAAQQAGDYYAAQMADKIPELYQAAYNMYLGDLAEQRNDVNMMRGLESDSYNQYLNQLGQYNTDRGFAYNQYLNGIGLQQDNLNTLRGLESDNYNQYLNQLGQYNTDRAFNYGVYSDLQNAATASVQDAAQRVEAFLAAGGDPAELDPDLVSRSGYTQAELAALQNYYASQLSVSGSGGGSSGGGGSRSSSSNNNNAKPELTVAQVNQAIKNGILTDKVLDAYEYYYGAPYYVPSGNASAYSTPAQLATAESDYESWNPLSGAGAIKNAGSAFDAWKRGLGNMVEGELDSRSISNQHGDSWVYVAGIGRVSFDELERYVDDGTVIETFDRNTNQYTYKLARNK